MTFASLQEIILLLARATKFLIREAKANGEWQKATLREDTTNIPADLKRALKVNRRIRHNFESLAPSHKKQFVYWITSAKTDKTRQRRIQETVRLSSYHE